MIKEREESDFQPFPPHFLEIAHLLFTHCLDDLSEGEELRVLLEDIEGLRLEKVRSGIHLVCTLSNASLCLYHPVCYSYSCSCVLVYVFTYM